MTYRLFISYCHKDEEYKNQLLAHLSPQIRAKEIEVWQDRMIGAGDEWENKIHQNLATSDVIVFIVSSDFINSNYCYGIELEKALEMEANNEAIVVPLIARPCNWARTTLSKNQALPRDGKAISTWQDTDSAFLNIVQGLEKSIEKHKNQKATLLATITNPATTTSLPTNQSSPKDLLDEKFMDWLDDAEIKLTHSRVDKVKLHDIYTWLDINILNDQENDRTQDFISSKELLKTGKYFVLGEEQYGKTSLLKSIYIKKTEDNFFPVCLDAKDIKKADISISLKKALSKQYKNLEYSDFISKNNKVLLIDNYDQIGLNDQYQQKYIEDQAKCFDYVVITANDTFRLILQEKPELEDFDVCDLMIVGHRIREKMAKKWVSLGIEESITPSNLYHNVETFLSAINTTIGKNVVPPKPIFILLMLQLFEANQKQNYELTSYGHCYQQLIYQALNRAKVSPNDIDKYQNILTELSWELFTSEKPMSIENLNDFFVRYGRKYLLKDQEKVIDTLISNSILREDNDELQFRYPYIYYFFVGKKIADSYLDEQEIQTIVEKLIYHLHREDYANILIFITHHTKNTWVLEKIKTVLNEMFSNKLAATLEKESLGFLDKFIKQLPKLIIEQRNIDEEREKHNHYLDKAEKEELNEDTEEVIEDDTESSEVLANLNQTFKGMEIAGQIIRNRHANLPIPDLQDLAESGSEAGLRLLNYIIELIEGNKDYLVTLIGNQVTGSNLTNEQVRQKSQQLFMAISYKIIYSVIRKIASSIGSKDAISIYQELETQKHTPAYQLIKISVQLQHQKKINIKSIREAKNSLETNLVAIRILRQMVIQHSYLFPVSHTEIQQLSSILGIKEQSQQLMQYKGKKLR